MRHFTGMCLLSSLFLAGGTATFAQESIDEGEESLSECSSFSTTELTPSDEGFGLYLVAGDVMNVVNSTTSYPLYEFDQETALVQTTTMGMASSFTFRVSSKTLDDIGGIYTAPTSITASSDGYYYFSPSRGRLLITSIYDGEGEGEGDYDYVYDEQYGGIFTCTPISGPTVTGKAVETLATTSASSQNRSILKGLELSSNPGGAGGVAATQNSLSFITPDVNGTAVMWAYVEWRQYSGGASGEGIDLVWGSEIAINPDLSLGLVMAGNKTELDNGTNETEVTSFNFGPYVSGKAGELDYDAYITIGKPDYDVDGTEFRGDRIGYGLAIKGEVDVPQGSLRPFLLITGSKDKMPAFDTTPANEVDALQVSLGGRYEWPQMPNGMTPYASIAFEATEVRSDIDGTNRFNAPRVGFGFEAPLEAGIFGMDVDAGKSAEDIDDVGVRFSYQLRF